MSKCIYCKEEHKLENTGCNNSGRFTKGHIPHNKGKHGLYKHSLEIRKEMSRNRAGKKLSEEHRKAISIAVPKGANHSSWKGGVYPENLKIRHSYRSREWSRAILKRDKTCVLCKSDKHLHADHIRPFATYPELRFELSNGRALCIECHKKTSTFGGKTYKAIIKE